MWDPQLFWAECYSKIIEQMIYKINFSLRGNAIESELSFTTAGALRRRISSPQLRCRLNKCMAATTFWPQTRGAASVAVASVGGNQATSQ
jgi:hypothetical protein